MYDQIYCVWFVIALLMRLVLMHFRSMLNMLHRFVFGTIFRIHFCFSPTSGSVHPSWAFLASATCFSDCNSSGVNVHRLRNCSYRSLTCSYDNPDFLCNILFTVSCNSYTYREKVARDCMCFSKRGNFLKFLTKFLRHLPQGSTCTKFCIWARYHRFCSGEG